MDLPRYRLQLVLCFLLTSCDESPSDKSNLRIKIPPTSNPHSISSPSDIESKANSFKEVALRKRFADSDGKSIDDVVDEWAKLNPDNAFMAVASLPTGLRRNKALLGFFRSVDWDQIGIYWGMLEKDGLREELTAALLSISTRNVPKDLNAAISSACHIDSESLRASLFSSIAHDLARKRSPQEAFDILMTKSDNSSEAILNQYIFLKSQETPENIVNWLLNSNQRQLCDNNLPSVLQNWSKKQPSQAVEWIHAHLGGPASTISFSSALTNWLSQEPETASRWINSLPKSEAKDLASLEVVRHLVERSSPKDEIKKWVSSIDSIDVRNKAMSLVEAQR